MAKRKSNAKAVVAYTGSVPGQCWELNKGSAKLSPLSAVKSPGCVVAIVPDRELVFLQFQLQKDLTTEQLTEAVEVRMFQDAGLNPMLEYKTAFSKRASTQDMRMLTIGAISASMGAIESATSQLTQDISYIDSLLPLSTLPYALYNASILEPKRDVFVYFQRDCSDQYCRDCQKRLARRSARKCAGSFVSGYIKRVWR
ncbi:hypothetical protein AGMMS50229_19890 [Campylobacterota bacterium]|nr:hypothetical protein AGMMS50229_19890 [Campylobacterota bacterium]